VSDRHVRLLRAVAKRRRQEVDDRPDDTERGSPTEEQDVERAAAVTNARLTASEARRRRPTEDQPGAPELDKG
jgi:hypothetical protein